MSKLVNRTELGGILILLFLYSCWMYAYDWPTFGHDPQRTGWASEESTLTPKNVKDLGLRWEIKLPNKPKALTALTAPVVADDVTTTQGIKALVYVAGSSDSFFAIDAKTGKLEWSRTFQSWASPRDPTSIWQCPQGVNATPVIDKRANTIYAIASDGRLYGLDLGTGKINFGPFQFVPPYSKDWSLNLWHGNVYTTISQGCGGAQSGIYAMNVKNPLHPIAQDLLSAKRGAAIWGRGGAVIGGNNRIYASTGDGEWNPAQGQYSDSIVAASGASLHFVDHYTPDNHDELTRYDLDISSASPVWFSYKTFDLLAAGGKEGLLYLLNADSLGEKAHDIALDSVKLANDEGTFEGKGIWGAISTWSDRGGTRWIYVPIWGPRSKSSPSFPESYGPAPHGSIMAFKVVMDKASNHPEYRPEWISVDLTVPDPPVVANGVLFVLSTGENIQQTHEGGVFDPNVKALTIKDRESHTSHAILYAMDARTGKVLWASGNDMKSWVHFSGLAVANGNIYAVDYGSNLYCFGLR
jgi:PQQ-like domain